MTALGACYPVQIVEHPPLICIPARLESTRLPRKLLLAESGRPLIVHTCQQAAQAFGSQAVLVCADHPLLVDAVTAAGFRALLTGAHHNSGTDRIAEAVAGFDNDLIINVQGDEPEIDAQHIRCVAALLADHSAAQMATLATSGDADDQADPNVVKVVLGHNQRAITFSRAPLIWDRDGCRSEQHCLRHLGIYAYRRQFLIDYHALPLSRLEQVEKLEQLRAIEAGHTIACAVVENAAPGIDSRSDYDAFLARLAAEQPASEL